MRNTSIDMCYCCIGVGIIFTLTIIGAVIGIPMIIAGIYYYKKESKMISLWKGVKATIKSSRRLRMNEIQGYIHVGPIIAPISTRKVIMRETHGGIEFKDRRTGDVSRIHWNKITGAYIEKVKIS